FAAVWKKGIDFVNQNPQEARKYLAKNKLTPEDVVDTVPMGRYYMAGELTDKHKAEFQKFIDFSASVRTLPEKCDSNKYRRAYRKTREPTCAPQLPPPEEPAAQRGVPPRATPHARADRRSTRARFPRSPRNPIPGDKRGRTCRARPRHSAPP